MSDVKRRYQYTSFDLSSKILKCIRTKCQFPQSDIHTISEVTDLPLIDQIDLVIDSQRHMNFHHQEVSELI